MLKPLYSLNRDHVGWIETGKFLFDTEMAYVGFLAKGYAWSGVTGFWLGSSENDHVFDTTGLVVAWSPGLPIVDRGHPLRQYNAIKPVTPVRPVRPVTPRRPLAPPASSAKWSTLTFKEWLALGAPPKPAARDIEAPVHDQTADPAPERPES